MLGQLELIAVDVSEGLPSVPALSGSAACRLGSRDMRSFAAFARMASLPFSGAGGMLMLSAELHSRTSEKSTEDKNPLKADDSDCVRRAISTEDAGREQCRSEACDIFCQSRSLALAAASPHFENCTRAPNAG